MDLRLSPSELEIENAVQTLFARHAGPDRAREMESEIDVDVLRIAGEAGFLDMVRDGPENLCSAVLVVEQAELAYVRAPIAARAIVAPELLENPPLTVGLVAGTDGALSRFAGQCDCYLVLDGDHALVATSEEVEIERVHTRWGYPLGRVHLLGGQDLGSAAGSMLRSRWQLALASEIAAAMTCAIEITTTYVTERHQFGRPIGSFQAVQHKLSETHVLAEGARWLARRAAGLGDSESALTALAYAADGIGFVVDNVHQVTGAMGITREYDLSLSTSRLTVLREELGGPRRLAQEAALARWGGP